MKKSVLLIILLFLSFGLHSFSGDAGIFMGGDFLHEDFEVEKKRYLHTEKDFSIGLESYCFFGDSNMFGAFGKLAFVNKDNFGMDLLVGPGFGFDIYDNIRIQTGAGFHTLFAYEKDNSDFSSENASLFKFSLGLGADFQVKFLSSKIISPVVGFDFSWNPYCRSGVNISGKSYYLSYKKYTSVAVRPYVGCVWNFPSQKNNRSQHYEYSQDF